jgi:O-antigen/teichoic acid export membrane protein
LNVLLNFALIPRYGALAAVWTTILSQAAVAFFGFLYGRDLPRASLRKPLLLSGAATLIMVAALILLERADEFHVVATVLIGAAIYGLTYLIFAMRSRAIALAAPAGEL